MGSTDRCLAGMAVFVILTATAAAQGPAEEAKINDPIAARVEKARRAYLEKTRKLREPVLKSLERAAESARKAGRLDMLKTIDEEREAFKTKSEIPTSVSTREYRRQMNSARGSFMAVLADARKRYVRADKIDEASKLDEELASLEEAAGIANTDRSYGPLLNTAEAGAAPVWLYTTTKPTPGWNSPGYKPSGWQEGRGAFGARGTPNLPIGTIWDTPDIWLRTTIYAPKILPGDVVVLRLRHDEAAEIYLNGELLLRAPGWNNQYQDLALSQGQLQLFREGKNVLAIHCSNKGGGQGVDVGIIRSR